MRGWWKTLLTVAILLGSRAHGPSILYERPDWMTPIAPSKITDNLYYVGSRDLASYLIVTPQGDILINSSLEASPALIRKPVNIVIVGSWNVNKEFRLVDKPGQPASYPGIADDCRKTFRLLKTLPCDVFLGAHGAYFDMLAKLDRSKAGAGQKVWIDPEGYRTTLAERQKTFEAELQRQETGGN
jgi:hypothetical protein